MKATRIKKLATQLIKEFALPLVITLTWTGYNLLDSISNKNFDFKTFMNMFGPTFFLASWIIGQYFRVSKQTKTEDNFSNIEERFNHLITKLEDTTKETISNITGGDSFAHLTIGELDNTSNSGRLYWLHNGNYPMYDIGASINDINHFTEMSSGKLGKINFKLCMRYESLSILTPNSASTGSEIILQDTDKIVYLIQFSARNGMYLQDMILRKIHGIWLQATRVVTLEGVTLLEKVDPDFPCNNGKLDWEKELSTQAADTCSSSGN